MIITNLVEEFNKYGESEWIRYANILRNLKDNFASR